MTVSPLVYLRTTTVYPVPPVCSAFWTVDDWRRTAQTVVEPLVLHALGEVWVATGERVDGRLLYRRATA